MNGNEISEKVLEAIRANVEEFEISSGQYDDELIQYGIDSISFIQIIVTLEEAFGIDIPDEKLLTEQIGTFNKMTAVVATILDARARI